MSAITSSIPSGTQVPSIHVFDSFYSDQSLLSKVGKVFVLCLAVVVVYVIFRVIKVGIVEGSKEPVIEGKLWIDSKLTGLIGLDGKCLAVDK